MSLMSWNVVGHVKVVEDQDRRVGAIMGSS